MKTLSGSLLLASLATLTASSAYADDCGTSDRVALPACAVSGKIQGTKPGIFVHNTCAQTLTVKFDKPGGDVRTDIRAGTRLDQETPPDSTKVSCCPRYNPCVNQRTPLQPPPAGMQNLALRKPATQSSTTNNGDAARAVDGNTDGSWSRNSVTHTDSNAQAWWQVDLGGARAIKQVVVYNRTDCCDDRLSNFEIKVSSDGNAWKTVATVAGQAQYQTVFNLTETARLVRVQLKGTNNLSLAEVQVFGPNLALGKPATQSSLQNDAVAGRAVDGNSDGNYNSGSVTHTLSTAQAWWQVDLGAAQAIREVVLYNRTDCCADRLSNFEIKVSSDGNTWTKVGELAGQAPQRSAYPMNASGRYVRVQLRGTNNLSLAEVEVF